MDYLFLGKVVPLVELESTRDVIPADFKSAVFTISPQRRLLEDFLFLGKLVAALKLPRTLTEVNAILDYPNLQRCGASQFIGRPAKARQN